MSADVREVRMTPIGRVRHGTPSVPRHWSVSDVEGELVLDPEYADGLKDVTPGSRIIVLFHFHKSPPFGFEHLTQVPPHGEERIGVFSICSPHRPNPIGLSVLEVLGVKGRAVRVRGLDMFDGTPVLDIKPYIEVS